MSIIEHATCLGCGCTCDDIDIVVERGRIVEARNACALGTAWFGDGSGSARARLLGRDAPLEDVLDEAARVLGTAERPLVYLAPDISCETQREGVAIADLLRAFLDSITSSTSLAALTASQERGSATATLGEIRNRSDVVVFWGVNPAERYPRYPSRCAPDPPGIHIPDGRRSRTVVSVDVGDGRGPDDSNLRITVSAPDEVPTLVALRSVVTAPQIWATGDAGHDALAWQHARALAPVMVSGRYVTIVHDTEPLADGAAGGAVDRADALTALAHALNARTRCALSALRAGGNRCGADSVITWQTGFPTAVDFARGAPRYRPHDASARVARGEVDAALVIGAAGLIPASVLGSLAPVACVVIGPGASVSPLGSGAAVAVDTAVAGIHEGGTTVRMDDVPLPLRACVSGPPAAARLVRALRERIWSARRARSA